MTDRTICATCDSQYDKRGRCHKRNRTPWYPPHIKPVRVGVYETRFGPTHLVIRLYWSGKHWAYLDDLTRASYWQSLYWRGLTAPHGGNK